MFNYWFFYFRLLFSTFWLQLDDKGKFSKGRRGGVQCSHDGYIYSYSRNHNSRDYWSCKYRKDYDPQCKGRLKTCRDVVISAAALCHTASSTKTAAALFIAELRDTKSTETAANVVREKLLSTPAFVQVLLPTMKNVKKSSRRRRDLGPSCAANIPVPSRESWTGGLFTLTDEVTSTGKRIVALSSESNLAVLNQLHQTIFVDGTFKICPRFFRQVWILRGYIMSTSKVIPLAYFLLEDKSLVSYSAALEILKTLSWSNSWMFYIRFWKGRTYCHTEYFPFCNYPWLSIPLEEDTNWTLR